MFLARKPNCLKPKDDNEALVMEENSAEGLNESY
jgi:hypothetical protein